MSMLSGIMHSQQLSALPQKAVFTPAGASEAATFDQLFMAMLKLQETQALLVPPVEPSYKPPYLNYSFSPFPEEVITFPFQTTILLGLMMDLEA